MRKRFQTSLIFKKAEEDNDPHSHLQIYLNGYFHIKTVQNNMSIL